MNKKLRKLITGMLLVCIMAAAGPFGQIVSWAETRVAFSDPSVMVGNEVTVNLKVTSDQALGKAELMLAYDANILEFISGTNANGGAGAIKVTAGSDTADQKDYSITLKFKALQAGSAQISVTSQEIYNADSQIINLDKQGSSTVKVTSPASSSKEADLKSLKISPGVLTPEFSPEVDSYTAEVDSSIEDLIVNAVAANADANVTLENDKGLQEGVTQVIVKVTAEDGQTVKNYTIQVTKGEGGATAPTDENGETLGAEFGDLKVSVNNVEYDIATTFDESGLPEGFEAGSYTYKGTEVMAGVGLVKDLTLLYLQDSDGSGSFFVYNEGADTFTKFVQVEATSKAIIVLPLDEGAAVPEGFAERKIEIDKVDVVGWTAISEGDPEYCLLYGMNWEGDKNFYRYDLSEKTIQRYFASGISNEKYTEISNIHNDLMHDYQIQFYILIAVSALALILLIVVIVLLRRGSGGSDSGWREKRPDRDRSFIDGKDDLDHEETFGKVTRYSREEFDNLDHNSRRTVTENTRNTGYRQVDKAEEEEFEDNADLDDDFTVETSLEEMENDLASHLAKETQSMSGETDSDDDDDFEFMDLDD